MKLETATRSLTITKNHSFSIGDTVEVFGNSENIEMVEYMLGSKGNITKRLGAEIYMVKFGELELPLNSYDLRLHSEQSLESV